MDINKKLEEVKEEYNAKIKNLNQTEVMLNKLRAEYINLEGQLLILNQIKKENDNSN